MELEALYLTQGSLPLNAFLLWQALVREENSSVVSLCFLLKAGTMSILCFKFRSFLLMRERVFILSLGLGMCGQIVLTVLEARGLLVLLLLACVFVRREMSCISPMPWVTAIPQRSDGSGHLRSFDQPTSSQFAWPWKNKGTFVEGAHVETGERFSSAWLRLLFLIKWKNHQVLNSWYFRNKRNP